MIEEFRRHLVAAEVFVNRMIVAWLNDNDRFELVQSLIGVRRSLHYTLSFNALALPSESELTAEIALESRDGALWRIWRAKEVAALTNLTRERIRQIECEGLRALRELSELASVQDEVT